MKDEKKAKKTFYQGVLILTVAGFVSKVCGFLYKVPLNALLQDEMANVNAAYAVYTLLYTVSTAGIPSAVSMSVSAALAKGRVRKAETVFKTAFRGLFLFGGLLSLALFLMAKPLSLLNSGGDSYLCLIAISPALVFTAVSAVCRGYFQGHGDMKPTAVSEIAESLFKTGAGLGFAYFSLSVWGLSGRFAGAASVLGISLGVGVGAFYLYFTYLKRQKSIPAPAPEEPKEPLKSVLKELLSLALPIAATSFLLNLASLIDSQCMRPLLETYYHDPFQAKNVYSDYSTGALTLCHLPGILIYPISASVIPFLTAERARKEENAALATARSALRTSAAFSLPCAFFLSVFASPLLSFVFRGDSEMALNAGKPLSLLGVSVFFVAWLTVSNGILQAYGKEKLPLISVGAGLLIKLAVTVFLTPLLGELGAPLGTVGFYGTALFLNMLFLAKETGHRLPGVLNLPVPLFLSAGGVSLSALCAFLCRGTLGNDVTLLLSALLFVLFYGISLRLFGYLSAEEWGLLPGGKPFFRLTETLFCDHFSSKVRIFSQKNGKNR
ncbi:MAG: polysaccharide biosynthesis protein [Clostridia bacterium]|nr:polysaccharide biosynthesis protein [Clostridia bacterium]